MCKKIPVKQIKSVSGEISAFQEFFVDKIRWIIHV